MSVAIGIAALALAVFAALGWWSQRGAPAGLAAGQLAPCGAAPNCVCSEPAASGDPHWIAPLALAGDAQRRQAALQAAITALGGRTVTAQGDYLHAVFESRWFRFVDDVEFRLLPDRVELRSASRVGYSDLGVNRRRVEALRSALSGS
jgi:uncharacterized protein (DUF1499 family)